MKPSSTLILKSVLVILGLAAIACCIFVIYLSLASDTVGYYKPILIGMVVPAIPFLIALFQAYKLLGLIDQSKAFSNLSINILKKIKYCAITIAAMYAAGMPYIFYAADRDDAPGVVAIGFIIIFASIVIATFAAVLQKLLQDALDIKSENDLTV
jgi:hypothetical protein